VVFAGAVCQFPEKLMGYDPNDKGKIAEMQESAGPSYFMSLVAMIRAAFVPGN
jgi:hypothetical protein